MQWTHSGPVAWRRAGTFAIAVLLAVTVRQAAASHITIDPHDALGATNLAEYFEQFAQVDLRVENGPIHPRAERPDSGSWVKKALSANRATSEEALRIDLASVTDYLGAEDMAPQAAGGTDGLHLPYPGLDLANTTVAALTHD